VRKGRKISGSPSSNSTWSGVEARASSSPDSFVGGYWTIPNIKFNQLPFEHTYGLIWCGIDGDNLSDLVQAGTGMETIGFLSDVLGFPLCVSSTYAWTEALPTQPNTQQATSIRAWPRDEIYVMVQTYHSAGGETFDNDSAIFEIVNYTSSQSFSVSAEQRGIGIGASEAEWIVERPTISYSDGTSFLPPLTKYSPFSILDTSVQTADGLYKEIGELGDLIVYNMQGNSGTILSTPVQLSGTNGIGFTWQAFQ
jgi:hypothetical protein